MDDPVFFVAGFALAAAALVFIGLLIWGAIEDGRDYRDDDPSHNER